MQCCQPHSNPSFSFFFSTLHRLSSSLNILKCLPLLLPASEKWWICNSDWLWRLVKNSLFLSHPPGKRVHFFPLTVACLPSDPSLFSKKISQCKGDLHFFSSPFFNPVLTIHLSVLLHVKIGMIVCACIFQGREGLICRQNNMLTSSTPHRTDVKTCGGVWLITPDSEKTPKIAVTRSRSRAGCTLYGNCIYQFGSNPVFLGWVSGQESVRKCIQTVSSSYCCVSQCSSVLKASDL